ncbi:unnamed protein product [Trifolium pratense]|uniref:Uncharacterized protein n=1 Tax=Trifolium pratense TaxID=57577 RepID=A0ACB0LF37_TRIPR|nr:unnamed protein product [Trifolium pratense]
MQMKNLKTLIVKTSFFSKPQVHLPNSLYRVLEWHSYSLHDIPSDFLPKNLSICKLPNSGFLLFKFPNSLKERVMISSSSFCIEKHYLLSMKVLRLDRSKCLTEISDVSGLQNLEEFSFERCKNLLRIHESVGFLNKLKILNAEERMRSIISFVNKGMMLQSNNAFIR